MVVRYTGTKASLAPIDESCAELWNKWLNDPEVALPLGDEGYMPISLNGQKQAVDAMADGHVFSVVDNPTGANVGRCMVFDLDHLNSTCMVGIFIGEKSSWGKGLGEDAMRLLLDYCFCILNMHSVMLGVYSFNARAIRLYQKLGFNEIGRRREVRLLSGVRYDAVLMDLLASEYTPRYLGEVINAIAGEG